MFSFNRNKSISNISDDTKRFITENALNAEVISFDILASEAIQKRNIYICDISAVVSECLSANAPIFVYIPKDKDIQIASSNMTYQDYCYTFSDVNELVDKMQQVLSGDDYLAESRQKAVDYFIGYEETLNEEFIKQLKQCSGEKI